MLDMKALAEATAAIVREHVGSATAPLILRIAALEEKLAAKAPEVGGGVGLASALIDRGGKLMITMSDGKAVDLGSVVGKDADPAWIAKMVADAVAALPAPVDGKDADPVAVAKMVAEAVAALPVPADGKDADPAEIARMVAEAVAAIPAPADGKDADPEVIERLVAEAVAALPAPVDGRSVDIEDVRPLVAAEVERAVGALPRAVEPETVKEMVTEAVEAAVAALPAPVDGKDADPELVAQLVKDAVAALPPAAPGKSVDIEDVRPLVAAEVERAVGALPAPLDGVGVAGAIIDRTGSLLLTLTDGSVRELGLVVGQDADPEQIAQLVKEAVGAIPLPKDGKDAFQLEDFTAEVMDDGRTVRFAMTCGDTQHAYQLSFPVMIYRDVFKEGAEYVAGDVVTWAGSAWHCDADTSEKPGEGSKAWTLAVKRGRDGKPAEPVKLTSS